MTEPREPQQAPGLSRRAPGEDTTSAGEPRPNRFQLALDQLRQGFRQLQWRPVLLFGLLAGALMPLTFLNTALSLFAGIIPVGAGLLLGRRVKGFYGLHGFVAGLIGAVVAVVALALLLFALPAGVTSSTFQPPEGGVPLTPAGLWLQLSTFIAFSLITFCTFGATMSGRTEERNRELRRQISERGGQLERPSTIRELDDLRGLSLPQLGSYVNNLFKKQGFQFKDYRFIDKDKHLDLWLEHEGEPWHLRLSVADKVGPGTVEGLYQEMRRTGTRRGVVVASTEFLPGAHKSAKGRPIVLIDGKTLYEIAEK